MFANDNLDLGQDILKVRDYIIENNISNYYIDYFGYVDVGHYGLEGLHFTNSTNYFIAKNYLHRKEKYNNLFENRMITQIGHTLNLYEK